MARSGRAHLLVPAAARAWQAMRSAAHAGNVRLIVVSAFRGFDYQVRLIQRHIAAGESVETVLQVLAPPGCSEHHSGRALDIGTLGCQPASLAFADTPAFAWLKTHASRFGFALSFPQDNPYGYQYEPWHWCWSTA
ncbi:M15 family metallopeptidase [bacterium]|nr:M15 family metallopeptidase [bacterium]